MTVDFKEAEDRLAQCVEVLQSHFAGKMHFAVFIMQRAEGGMDEDTIEGTFMSTLPPDELRSCVLGMIDGTDPGDVEVIPGNMGGSIN